MGRVGRSRHHRATAGHKKAKNGLYHARDLDLVFKDVKDKHPPIGQGIDKEDLPGGGQFCCISCSKFFIDQTALDKHMVSKAHKKRSALWSCVVFSCSCDSVKELREEPPSQQVCSIHVGLIEECMSCPILAGNRVCGGPCPSGTIRTQGNPAGRGGNKMKLASSEVSASFYFRWYPRGAAQVTHARQRDTISQRSQLSLWSYLRGCGPPSPRARVHITGGGCEGMGYAVGEWVGWEKTTAEDATKAPSPKPKRNQPRNSPKPQAHDKT